MGPQCRSLPVQCRHYTLALTPSSCLCRMSLAPCSVSHSLYFIMPPCYFPSVPATAASLSAGKHSEGFKSHWHKSVGGNTSSYTRKSVSDLFGPAEVFARRMMRRCGFSSCYSIIQETLKHCTWKQNVNTFLSSYMPYVKLGRTKYPSGRRCLWSEPRFYNPGPFADESYSRSSKSGIRWSVISYPDSSCSQKIF